MLRVSHCPHLDLHTLEHPRLERQPLALPLYHVTALCEDAKRRPELKRLQRLPDSPYRIRRQGDVVRDTPQEAVTDDARFARVRVPCALHREECVSAEKQVGAGPVEAERAREVAAAGYGGEAGAREDGLGSLVEEVQVSGVVRASGGPALVCRGHVDGDAEGRGPVGPCAGEEVRRWCEDKDD